MKTSVLLIAASAAMAVFLVFAADITYGMGAKGNAVEQQEKSVSGQPGDVHQGNRTKEEISSETSGTVNRNSAAPEKRPRLKYRDERECPC
jgi:hypothetical protein